MAVLSGSVSEPDARLLWLGRCACDCDCDASNISLSTDMALKDARTTGSVGLPCGVKIVISLRIIALFFYVESSGLIFSLLDVSMVLKTGQ